LDKETVSARLKGKGGAFTRSERRVVDVIFENYPVSGLGSITKLAEKAKVSTPTVARLVQKINFKGFPQFQEQLRKELDRKISTTGKNSALWASDAPEAHILNRVTEAVVNNVRRSLDDIDAHKFEEMCELLCDTNLFISGGRVTRTFADHFFLYMQIVRPNVYRTEAAANGWMYSLLDIEKGDVVFLYDIRRYEPSVMRFAEMAKDKGAVIMLLTDQWQSPINSVAEYSINSLGTMPTGRDSSVNLVLFNEIIIAQVQHVLADLSQDRVSKLEVLFEHTQFFGMDDE